MQKKILIVEDEYIVAHDLKRILEKAGYEVCGLAQSAHQAIELSEQVRPDMALLDISLKGRLTGIDLARMLTPKNIPFIFLSANGSEEALEAAKTTQPYGYLIKPFRPNDVLAAIEIAHYRYKNHGETLLRLQSFLQLQLDGIVNEESERTAKLLKIGKMLLPYFPFDYLGLELYEHDTILKNCYSHYRVGYDEYNEIAETEIARLSGVDTVNYTFNRGLTGTPQPEISGLAENDGGSQVSPIQKKITAFLKMKAMLVIPIELQKGIWCWLYLSSKQPGAFTSKHLELINQLQGGIHNALRSVLKLKPDPVAPLSGPAQKPREIREGATNFAGIVGKSQLLLNVLDEVKLVAPMDSSVLILGESGTGKEKIAECIHRLSGRSNGPFIKINCAGFPSSLIESELFGHEKGAFTGALERRIGKFELADKGTIFLDEVGEMPLESQVKILRVLQERQFERIGSHSTNLVDIRIIAATNRNLEQEVVNNRFRLDLYYRLNVFPITMPPLRERLEDIPLLAAHFISLFNQKTGRNIRGLSAEALDMMQQYHWPGNIRELEHLMERSLIMCKGDLLETVLLPGLSSSNPEKIAAPGNFKRYKEFERDYLKAVLEKCNGRLSGKDGAASILGLPVSTLNSKLIKLGIKKGNK